FHAGMKWKAVEPRVAILKAVQAAKHPLLEGGMISGGCLRDEIGQVRELHGHGLGEVERLETSSSRGRGSQVDVVVVAYAEVADHPFNAKPGASVSGTGKVVEIVSDTLRTEPKQRSI